MVSATKLVLLSRRSPSDAIQENINKWQQHNVNVEVVNIDIAETHDVIKLFQRFGQDIPRLKGIIHAAGIINDSVFLTQQW